MPNLVNAYGPGKQGRTSSFRTDDRLMLDLYGLTSLVPGELHVIQVDDFHKSYDRTVAVRGLTFRVRAGQILGLIGPNGAGKTSTLRVIAGIIPASCGRLTVNGHCLTTEPIEAKSCLGFVPDDPALFDDLTIDEHLTFFATAYQVDDATAKADRLLQQFQLVEKRGTVARDLSRGMRQKLAICCAFLHNPKAILFDEPLTGLDPHGIRTLKKAILGRASEDAAVVISSHLLAMVEDICTHVLILEEGEQRFWGPLDDLKSRFAAGQRESSLEDIFFRATRKVDATSDPVSGPAFSEAGSV